MDRNTKIVLGAGFIVMASLLLFPVSAVFITMLLGLLFIPPVIVAGYFFVYGFSVISSEISENEKDVMVIQA